MKKNDKLQTPLWVYEKLGVIDLDPCAGINTNIGKTNWAIERGENGLTRDWFGFVFCNPPFSQKETWAKKMIEYGSGILLLPERMSAPWAGPLAKKAGRVFTMGKKINFIGGSSSNNLGTILFLFGDDAFNRVCNSGLPGTMSMILNFTERV